MRLFCAVLLLTAVAWGDVGVFIRTDPPGARVIPVRRGALANTASPAVGLTNGERLVLSVPDGQSSITLTLEHDLCQPKTVTIDLQPIQSGLTDSYPATGSIELTFKSPFHAALNFLKRYGILLVLAVLPVVYLVLRSRKRERDVAIREQQARTVTELVVGDASKDELLGSLFDGYRLVQKLGQGGMATVYKAFPEERLKDEREAVALKILAPDLTEDPSFVGRFNREKDVYGLLVHRNIVRIYGYGEFKGRYYLVMELVNGSTLRPVQAKGRILELVKPIFQAVHFAHQKGIVHRDLKPENVMVTDEGQVKVMDFGMARASYNNTVTATGAVLGTPVYMAPEQIQGILDPRSDQYALGIMLYEMFAGHPPFVDENPVTTLVKHLQEEPAPLDVGPPGEVVLKMLAKSPQERYPDLLAALEALEASLR